MKCVDCGKHIWFWQDRFNNTLSCHSVNSSMDNFAGLGMVHLSCGKKTAEDYWLDIYSKVETKGISEIFNK